MSHTAARKRGFTLIELLVVIAIIAVLVGILVPVLSSARSSARSVACLSNLRQINIICRTYADENKGKSPALGQPYAALPTWSLVVAQASGRPGTSTAQLFTPNAVLVCPASRGAYGSEMTRTYAINATGHAGMPANTGASPPTQADADNYDDPAITAHIKLDNVQFPHLAPLLIDSSAPAPTSPNLPPPTRTSSVLDFRNPLHVPSRIGLVHFKGRDFNTVFCDGSAAPATTPAPYWATPLP